MCVPAERHTSEAIGDLVSVLLDTDVVIEIQRGRDRQIGAQWADLVTSGAMILYSPVVAAETGLGTPAGAFSR